MDKLLIGWSEVSITPDKKIALIGQFAERISEYVEKPITVTAMAIEKGEEQIILVSCDLGAVSWRLRDEVRSRLADNTVGIDPMKIVFNATHVHTGPGYTDYATTLDKIAGTDCGLTAMLINELPDNKHYVKLAEIEDNPEIASESELLVFLADRMAEAAMTAWNNRAPGSFSNAFGRAPIGMCRRACYTDGPAQMWGDTDTAVFTQLEGGNDSGVELLYVFDEDKKLKGIVANIACPAQCVQHRLFVSPDFWGEAKMLLRQRFGDDIYLLAQCSAAGDQCPVDLVRWVEPESDVHDPNLKRNNPPKRKADPS
ncbi:MAG: hypothetical protein MJ099_02970, partial [Clostridia bacterium]|nr:hypothetical protein [Clostridia bacterium]